MRYFISCLLVFFTLFSYSDAKSGNGNSEKKLAYLVSDISIPFWQIMAKGIQSKATQLGYKVRVYSATNIKKTELENAISAIRSKVDGLIISPISSSTAVTIQGLAQKNTIPVVISDIGTDGGEYVSYISSDNKTGAYELGKILVKKMKQLQWDKGTVGIVSIPQKRLNGKLRTQGFMKALNEAGIKSSGLYQQVDFSYKETYEHSMKLISEDPNLRAIWLQGSDKYKGALDAIASAGKEGEVLLICFDAEPEFLDMIPQGILVGAAMQQPFLIGEKAVEVMDKHISGLSVEKNIQMPILAISNENIAENLPVIERNVLGIKYSDK